MRIKPWQFGRAATGRKYRIEQMRLAQLCVVLSRFDYSGDARHIYAGIRAILRALIAYAQTRPADEAFSWSRATLFRSLKRLETAGIMRRAGYSGYRTRRRALVPEALLREPIRREPETSGRVESETSGGVNLRHKNSKETARNLRGGSVCAGVESGSDGRSRGSRIPRGQGQTTRETLRSSNEEQQTLKAAEDASAQVEAIKAALQNQKFLWSMVEHATRWEIDGGELRLFFRTESHALAEMLQCREPMERLRTVLNQVVGQPLRVRVKRDEK
jgi:hypothetical protein